MIDDDMKMEALKQTNYVKSIVTAQGKMDLERKGKQSYQGWMFCRLLAFSNGDLQALYDRSNGFYRRQLILTTKEKATDRMDDPDIADKMKDEAEGVFLWMFAGLQRLVSNKFQFTESERIRNNREYVKRDSNNLIDFMEDEGYGRRHTVKVEGTNNETKVVKQDDESKIILVDGLHDAIISEETFERAQSLLAKRAAHRKTRSDSTNIYPLTGLIKCPDCGKNLFGYTAPQRPRKNGKEGFYPRYISYRCISGRDRNGLICSLANKYYSGTKLEKEVRDVISAMVTIPEFVELISKKVDCETDIERLRKKRAGIEAEHNKYRNNLMQTEKRLSELDAGDRHYEKKVDSLNRVLDDIYDKLDDAQTRLDQVDDEITMVQKSTMTKESIFEMLEGFSKYYDVMSPEDKKGLLRAMISSIEINELPKGKRADGRLIKTIHFTFPVTYDGESGVLFVSNTGGEVETVVLLSRETNPLTVEVRMEVETGEVKEHPTYKRIQEYVQEKYGFKVHTAYIAEVKRMVGLDMHKAPNAVEQRKHEYHPCPPEKVEAIKDALRHFGLISE